MKIRLVATASRFVFSWPVLSRPLKTSPEIPRYASMTAKFAAVTTCQVLTPTPSFRFR